MKISIDRNIEEEFFGDGQLYLVASFLASQHLYSSIVLSIQVASVLWKRVKSLRFHFVNINNHKMDTVINFDDIKNCKKENLFNQVTQGLLK